MHQDADLRTISYAIIALGCVLSLVTAIVPFYTAGYELLFGVLLIGLLPYVVYGAFTEIVRGWPLVLAGMLVLGIDLLAKIPERFLRYDGYADGAVYYAPLFSTFIVLPVFLALGRLIQKRREDRIRPKSGAGWTR